MSNKLARKIRCFVPTIEPLEARQLLTVAGITFNEFPQIAMGTNFLQNLAPGRDGNVYFSSGLANNVDSISPAGVVKVYDVTAISPHGPGGVAAGSDGNVYFNVGNNFGVVTLPAGTVSEIPLSQALNSGQRMILGPDGNFWVDDFFSTIERVTPAGQVTDFSFSGSGSGTMVSFNGGLYFSSGDIIRSISTSGTFGNTFTTINGGDVEALAVGSDGNLWYTEQNSVNSVVSNYYGYVTPAGVQQEFASTIGPVSGIAAGRDGNIYFRAADYLVGVNTAGAVVATQNLGGGNSTDGKELIAGPDGNLWYNENFNDRIGVAFIQALAMPTVGMQPASQNVVAGASASFTAIATGNPTPTVQWQISTNGTTFSDIPGATSTTYTFTATAGQNGDLFRAVFTNSQGSATSSAAGLTVTPALAAPVITTQPGNQSAAAGANISFIAAASGTPVPTVQWQSSTDGITFGNISGATSANYVFTAVVSQDGEFFRAVFTNSQGSATTSAAALTVTAAPQITTQPVSQNAAPGQNVSLIASASGNPAPTVQWQISTNGTTFSNISGATATTYIFSPTLDQNGDQFRAVFTNSHGSATTSAATLGVSVALTAPAIVTQPQSQNTQAGQSVSFFATASGNPTPTVQWQISTDGVTFSDISGATATTYSVTPESGQNGDQFRAVFTNSQGSATTNAVTLAVAAAPVAPTITAQPTNQNVPAGQIAVFSAAADGTPTPTVQWQISTDGVTFNDIPGATSATYGVAASTGEDGQLFRAVFTNSQGSVTTNSATLSILGSSAAQSPIVPTLGKVTLPAVMVVGVRFNGKVTVIMTNTGAIALTGNFRVDIYANANPVLDGNQTLIISLRTRLSLKPAKSRSLVANIRSLPAGLAPGAYDAVIEVTDPEGGLSTTATAQPFQLQAATVALNIGQAAVLPATIAAGKSGSIEVTLTNTGNVIATGPLVLTLSPSSDGVTPVAGLSLGQVRANHVRIAPGKTARFKLRFKISAATPAGAYYPYLSASLAGITQTVVGLAQFTIG